MHTYVTNCSYQFVYVLTCLWLCPYIGCSIVCTCIAMYFLYVYVCILACIIHVHNIMCVYVCMYVHTYVCMYIHMYVCTYVCMYICMHACTCTYDVCILYVCMIVILCRSRRIQPTILDLKKCRIFLNILVNCHRPSSYRLLIN